MDTIQQWFDNKCPYLEGVQLYASLPGCNRTLLNNFSKRQSSQLHEKLKYELKKRLSDSLEVKIVQPKQIPVLPIQDNTIVPETSVSASGKTSVFFHELPEELRPVLLDANTHFKEMCLLKVQLNELPGHKEKEALSIQIKIRSLQKKNALCWKKIDYYRQHKQLLQEKEKETRNLSPAKMLQNEQYLFAAISKLKKRLEENKDLLKLSTSVKESNIISRKISKQHANILNKETELQQLKDMINGEG
jgi:hypothetical protein